MTEIWDPALADDLEKFVMFIYPWGQPNTPLERFKEPRTWQRDELQKLTEHIRTNRTRVLNKQDPLVYRSATVSGRGVGKSALLSWLEHWMMSTRLGSSTIATANNELQLKTKTWAEVGKWLTLALNSHWFEKQALSVKPADWFKSELEKQMKIDTGYYYSQATLWDETNPDAFAGAHNQSGILLLYDESSGIPSPIWKVSEGFFTEPIVDRYWLAFSNGRRNTGEFFECFHKQRNFWRRRNLDSRTVEGTDKTVLEEIIQKYGDDSDEARIEVKGEFPRQGDKQFISRDIVNQAQTRDLVSDPWAGLIMGVDPARFGDDATVIRFRQGRDARSIPPVRMKGADNMAVANRCAELINQFNPDAVCIDAGNGTGIIDRLREMGFKVHEVWFGKESPEQEWANNRTYLWAQMRDWLRGGCIDADVDLETDLTSPQYKYQGGSDRQRLDTKEELKARGFSSPDNADALACTFHVKVARRDGIRSSTHSKRNRTIAKGVDYKIFG